MSYTQLLTWSRPTLSRLRHKPIKINLSLWLDRRSRCNDGFLQRNLRKSGSVRSLMEQTANELALEILILSEIPRSPSDTRDGYLARIAGAWLPSRQRPGLRLSNQERIQALLVWFFRVF